ncbi:uncharacterized protein BYT42DRAFT_391215 [Radiomyces spectabilis]|uniref:uncharacterized protein n=1 Tax=Radiomyces spectabilis TaxID=64574 RepID=UPI002220DBFD|nr:uncharacterized protein BYT42DRAFT_391215 [Radiomyces spectabilis]KAI8376567.1 hypothetical protein BYT42DRAFT_391215 [Radiomyces spectabilis]
MLKADGQTSYFVRIGGQSEVSRTVSLRWPHVSRWLSTCSMDVLIPLLFSQTRISRPNQNHTTGFLNFHSINHDGLPAGDVVGDGAREENRRQLPQNGILTFGSIVCILLMKTPHTVVAKMTGTANGSGVDERKERGGGSQDNEFFAGVGFPHKAPSFQFAEQLPIWTMYWECDDFSFSASQIWAVGVCPIYFLLVA